MFSFKRAAMAIVAFAVGGGMLVAPSAASAQSAPAAPAPVVVQAAPEVSAAGGCVQLWNPYKKKIGNSWYVEIGGRLHNCGATYLVVELQQKRWWGWDGRGSKTITRKGDANPRAKCKDFKTTTWRLHAFWYKRLPNGKIEKLGQWVSKKPFVTKC